MKLLIAIFLLGAGLASAQCKLVPNPDTGLLDCIGGPAGPAGPTGANGEITDEALQSGRHIRCADAGASDTYTCTMTPAATSYVVGNPGTDGQLGSGSVIAFKPNTVNTGAATLTIGALASKAIKQADGATDPADGTLAAGRWYLLTYDGTVWQLPGGASGGVSTLAGTSQQIVASAATGAVTLSIATNPTLPGTTTGTFSGNITGNVTGNASTATSASSADAITTGAISGLTEDTTPDTALDQVVTFDSSAAALKRVKLVNLGFQPIDTDLTALAGNSTNGIWARTGSGTGSARTVTGTSNEVALTNGDGVAGNPTIALASTMNLSGKVVRIPNGTALPGTCTVGDEYMDTDATSGQRFYLCESANTWALQGDGGGGGGAAFSTTVATTYSATPTFTVPSATTTGANFKITLTGNVTSSTLASAVNGQMLNWTICQDGTGGRSFVWPTNVVGGITISSTLNSQASTCYQETFVYDGTNAYGRWEVTAGPTGALVKSATNQIDIDTTIVPRVAAANVWTAAQTFMTKYTVGEASLSAAATSDNVLFSLGASQIIKGCIVKHSANFTGGSVTGVTVSVGDGTTADKYCPVLTVSSGAGNTGFAVDNVLGKSTFAAQNVTAHFACAGANCDTLTAGSVDIYVEVQNLP